jgi:uncharacterized protein (TIGR00725 family)
VIGKGSPDPEVEELAFAVGELLARSGAVVANPYCTHVVATGVGHARNLAVVSSGDAVIAVGGEWGTLSEIAFARALGRTVVAVQSWTVSEPGAMEAGPGIEVASDPQAAVDLALHAAEAGR